MRLLPFQKIRLAFFIFFVGALTFAASSVYANVTVTPTLIVIEGRDRYADISVINSGDKVQDYEMSWRFFAMSEKTGLYQERDKSTTDFDLTQHIVFTPRKVRLGPGEPQRVRLGIRLKGEPPPPGDYRAHMEFVANKPPPPPAANQKGPKERGATIGIGINVGFSIPVVYRVGESDAVPVIGDVTVKVNEKTQKLEASIPVTRSGGPFGIMGHLYVYYNDDLVGQVRNANIFPEISERVFTVPLKAEALTKGTLSVMYYGTGKHEKELFTEKAIAIGG